jgi:hypothetical protein
MYEFTEARSMLGISSKTGILHMGISKCRSSIRESSRKF